MGRDARRSFALVLATAVCVSGLAATAAAPSSAAGTGGSTTPRWTGSVDTTSKAAVLAAYTKSFAPALDRPTGWTGHTSGCRAGTTSAASRAATLRALNFSRSLAGLAPVTFSPTLNARSQRTALMLAANRALSHTPPRSWRCWTSTGAANAGRSNILLVTPRVTSLSLVSLYLEDPGAGNRAAGHRRWLLNPFATQLGTGSTNTTNALTVMGPQSVHRPNPAWVSWPTAGWFPDDLEPGGRWSLSAGSSAVSFKHATVRVWRNGVRIRAVRNPVQDGYARNTLVWQQPASVSRTGNFHVVVSGIKRAGSSTPRTRTYDVRMLDTTP